MVVEEVELVLLEGVQLATLPTYQALVELDHIFVVLILLVPQLRFMELLDLLAQEDTFLVAEVVLEAEEHRELVELVVERQVYKDLQRQMQLLIQVEEEEVRIMPLILEVQLEAVVLV
tara:strand:+ start:160 stop:513 length:354 start_codon:yes stop_codon:yes gene_type:complete